MWLVDAIRGMVSRIRAALSPQEARMIREILGDSITSSGIAVGSESSMRLVTVQNCVRLRASTLARLPCHLMRVVSGGKEKAKDHPLYEVLLNQPNSWMTAPEFWEMAEAHISLTGNFYAYKLTSLRGQVAELVPLKDGSVDVEQDEKFRLTYKVRMPDGNTREIPQEKMFHLRGMTLDGVTGVNPIQYARETIGLALAGEQFLAKYFASGMHPGAIIKHPLRLNTQAHADLRNMLKEKYQGLGKSHEFMLIDEGMDIQFPSIKLVDAQFLEQMKMTESQICGLFRVPLMLIGASSATPTYASAEQFMLFYQMFSVDAPKYESAIRRMLLTPEERASYFAKFNLNALQRGDFKTRMEGYQVAINTEIMSPNEARELEDWNPYEGGDEYRTRTSTVRESPASDEGAQSDSGVER